MTPEQKAAAFDYCHRRSSLEGKTIELIVEQAFLSGAQWQRENGWVLWNEHEHADIEIGNYVIYSPEWQRRKPVIAEYTDSCEWLVETVEGEFNIAHYTIYFISNVIRINNITPPKTKEDGK